MASKMCHTLPGGRPRASGAGPAAGRRGPGRWRVRGEGTRVIQELEGRTYDNHFEALAPAPGDYVLHYRDGACLTRVLRADGADADAGASGDVIELPCLADYPQAPDRVTYLFSIGEEGGERPARAPEGERPAPCRFFLALDDELASPAGFTYESVGWLRHVSPDWLLFAAVTGAQLDRWYRDNRFCSRCGHRTELAPRSREIVCPECAKIVYPKIQPGVICAVLQLADDPANDQILLTRYAGRTTALWALVAGFTEIGEPVEDTVRREVMEEVGLRVRDLRYHASQPWSFSDTLLMGFWCEVDGSADITVDHSELKEARWFTRAEIPLERTNDRASMTGQMIELFRLRGRDALDAR